MVEIDRTSNKDIYLHGQKRTSFEQKSNLPPLKTQQNLKRLFSFSNGRKVEAEHIIIPGNKVAVDTIAHPINPRNQIALDDDAVRDILEQIGSRGVDKEGIAIQDGAKYLIIEGSRRRYCCIKTQRDFPLWIIHDEISLEETYEIINSSQSSRKFSYRELGMQYLKQMQEFKFSSSEALADYLHTSKETVRKRLQAAKIDQHLINLFPDAEGIPNSFYARLSKIEKELVKYNYDISDFVSKINKEVDLDKETTIENQQNQLIDYLITTVKTIVGSQQSTIWKTHELKQFKNKDKYAKVSRSPNGRKVRFEFNRLNNNFIIELEKVITDHLNKAKEI